jgi:hypothetical protein
MCIHTLLSSVREVQIVNLAGEVTPSECTIPGKRSGGSQPPQIAGRWIVLIAAVLVLDETTTTCC